MHEAGPFETWDMLGVKDTLQQMEAAGYPAAGWVKDMLDAGFESFYQHESGEKVGVYDAVNRKYVSLKRPEGMILLKQQQVVSQNLGASLRDIGDGVACLEFHTKMNALDEGVVRMLQKAGTLVDGKRFVALVLHNESANFSVGANIGIALFAANLAMWPVIESSIADGQKAFQAIKHAPFPVVGAPSGMALGGGCEILLHCNAVQAHAETYMGLVEVGVGVVPGWGGCKEMVTRWQANPRRPGGPMPGVAKVFEMISTAYVSTSAEEAKEALFLRDGDGITMNRDRLLADAKARALAMVAAGYQPQESPVISLPGASGRVALEMAVDGFRHSGMATPHDEVVAKRLARVVTGGDTDVTETITEDQLYALEREAFMALVQTPGTLARIEHMLETGKPLRN
jgi:3-hydroxyacyl-CoA dehydrogenase